MSDDLLPELTAAFGLVDVHPESLSWWSLVHRARVVPRGHAEPVDVVVKLTGRTAERAAGMAGWTRALAAGGFPVVAPVDLDGPNPRQVGEHWYAVYPFVAGRPYDAERDVAALGDLLGRLHATSLEPEVRDALRSYAWPESGRDDADADLASLADKFPRVLGEEAGAAALEAVRGLVERWWTVSFPALRAAEEAGELPRAGVTSDYKSANVVIAEDGPVIVDPDNGGWEPRLFDLAMAVVLLHNDSDSAPGRMMTAAEWEAFHAAYARHVTLTDRERALWPAALDHMLWEEGTWALEDNDDDAYAQPRQGGYLRDLATMPVERYRLPGE